MSASRPPWMTPGSRVLPAVIMLALALGVAVAHRPHWSTILLGLAIVGVGAGRSLTRTEAWRPADDITTFRLGLIIVFVALILGNTGYSWPAATVAALALLLDTADGQVARRTRTTSAGGAFDVDVDALAVLILAAGLVPVWGWWALLPGLFSFAFRAVSLVRPAWRRTLPASFLRKTIGVAQGILLLTAGSPLGLSHPVLGLACVGIALTALTFSFGRDILRLEDHARRERRGSAVEAAQSRQRSRGGAVEAAAALPDNRRSS